MSKTVTINLVYGEFEVKHSGSDSHANIIIGGKRQHGCDKPFYKIKIPVDIWYINYLVGDLAQIHKNRIKSVMDAKQAFQDKAKIED